MDLLKAPVLFFVRKVLRAQVPVFPYYDEYFDPLLLFSLWREPLELSGLSLMQLRLRLYVCICMDSLCRSGDLARARNPSLPGGLVVIQVQFVRGGLKLRFLRPKELRVNAASRSLYSRWVYVGKSTDRLIYVRSRLCVNTCCGLIVFDRKEANWPTCLLQFVGFLVAYLRTGCTR